MAQIFFKKHERKASAWATLGLVTVLFAGATFLLAGPLFQIGTLKSLWTADAAFTLRFRLVLVGLGLSGLGAVFTLFGILHSMTSPRVRISWRGLLAVLLIGLMAWPMSGTYRRIHEALPGTDLSTSPQDPPAFLSGYPEGAEAATADTLAATPPRFVSLVSPLSPAALSAKALGVVRALKWRIVATDVAGGRLEAEARDRWFGLHTRVAIRILPQGTGSILDIRAISGMGEDGWGLNAATLRAFLDRMAA